MISAQTVDQTITLLQEKFGEDQLPRIRRGVRQVAQFWERKDGGRREFEQFCLQHFIAEPQERDRLFQRFQSNLEALLGHLHQAYRAISRPLHVQTGTLSSVDMLFARMDVFAHVSDDFFDARLAFVALLNFPLFDARTDGKPAAKWSRREWAEARLAGYFAERIPGEVRLRRAACYAEAEEYVYGYNIHMDQIRCDGGRTLFPAHLKLISHWGLRDELKAQYARASGLPQQQMITRIMERIIRQEIPQQVIDRRGFYWNPLSNELFDEAGGRLKNKAASEGGRRYEMLWSVFEVEKKVDLHSPLYPRLIDRRFGRDREIPEETVENLLLEVLKAPVLRKIAGLISQKLQRPLQAFDIWYPALRGRRQYPEEFLSREVRRQFPTVSAFQDGLGTLLEKLGFSPERARYLHEHIRVEAARGAGHAMGARMRGDHAYLRTRVPEGGMDYKGFNTAMHELGHTVEQVFSMNDIDHYSLEGVPNTAFTEAFAFAFQGRDLQVLGLESDKAAGDGEVLQTLWQTYEIAGVGLLDMYIWRWMYENPTAGSQALQEAVCRLAQEIWNQYFAPVLGVSDQVILAIYSHLIYCGLYTPDYVLGQLISFQIESFLRNRPFAGEVERMCRLGRLSPEVWMQQAVGQPLSAATLIDAAEAAVQRVQRV